LRSTTRSPSASIGALNVAASSPAVAALPPHSTGSSGSGVSTPMRRTVSVAEPSVRRILSASPSIASPTRHRPRSTR